MVGALALIILAGLAGSLLIACIRRLVPIAAGGVGLWALLSFTHASWFACLLLAFVTVGIAAALLDELVEIPRFRAFVLWLECTGAAAAGGTLAFMLCNSLESGVWLAAMCLVGAVIPAGLVLRAREAPQDVHA